MDEKQQILKVLKGDTSAFSYFVDSYQDMAITIAYRICNNMQDTEDIVQDAYVKAFHNLHSFRMTSKFSTWFYRIVYNTAINNTKMPEAKYSYLDYDEIDSSVYDIDISAELEKEELNRIVNIAMEKLSPDESVILTLFYLEENPIKDIALICGISEANTKVKLHRARKQMKQIVEGMMKFDYK